MMESSKDQEGCGCQCACAGGKESKGGGTRRTFLTYAASTLGVVGAAAVAWPLID
ncbi:MAG: twin-arginine translocation signal domain-containing protein, partial [Alphaproteobacteria bacterium]|nr:twin-arginine translocation signal domain-containing protein [Alphaproteobacteria bacterium]